MRPSHLAAALTLVFALPLAAQTPPPKPAPKAAAKPAAAVPIQQAAKPRPKLMTRDELRACLARNDENVAEVKAIEADDKVLAEERAGVLKDRDAVKARNDALDTRELALKAEIDAVGKRGEGLKAELEKMKKAERIAAAAAYDKEIAAINAKADAHNADKRAFMAEVAALEQRIDGFNKRKDALGERADKVGDKQDLWRTECGNRPYNEDDEKAIMKEKAAAKAAAPK